MARRPDVALRLRRRPAAPDGDRRSCDLPGHGFRWFPAVGGLFVPFEDGSSIQLWNDDARCEAEIGRFAPKDLAGWRAMQAAKRRLTGRSAP